MLMYVGCALVWFVVLAKVPAVVRGRRSGGRTSYWLSLFFLALCITTDRDPIYWAASAFTGVPNLAHGLSYAAAILGGFFGQLFFLSSYDHARLARERSWRMGVLAVGLIVYAVLFALGPAQLPTDPAVPHLAASTWAEAAFRIVLSVMVCGSLVEISWLAWRFSAAAALPSLRLGMRLVSLGCAFIVVRVSIEYLAFPVWSAGSNFGESWSYSGALYDLNLLAMAGAALLAGGSAIPAVDRQCQARRVAAARRAARKVLSPLWEAMRAITPALSNVRPSRRPGRARRSLRHRNDLLELSLYRMVAEIRDGYVRLWRYRELRIERELRARGAASGLRGIDLDTYVDAGSLRQAARAYALSQLATHPVGGGASMTGSSFEAEVDYLTRVAAWWTRFDEACPAGSVDEAVRAAKAIVEG